MSIMLYTKRKRIYVMYGFKLNDEISTNAEYLYLMFQNSTVQKSLLKIKMYLNFNKIEKFLTKTSQNVLNMPKADSRKPKAPKMLH